MEYYIAHSTIEPNENNINEITVGDLKQFGESEISSLWEVLRKHPLFEYTEETQNSSFDYNEAQFHTRFVFKDQDNEISNYENKFILDFKISAELPSGEPSIYMSLLIAKDELGINTHDYKTILELNTPLHSNEKHFETLLKQISETIDENMSCFKDDLEKMFPDKILNLLNDCKQDNPNLEKMKQVILDDPIIYNLYTNGYSELESTLTEIQNIDEMKEFLHDVVFTIPRYQISNNNVEHVNGYTKNSQLDTIGEFLDVVDIDYDLIRNIKVLITEVQENIIASNELNLSTNIKYTDEGDIDVKNINQDALTQRVSRAFFNQMNIEFMNLCDNEKFNDDELNKYQENTMSKALGVLNFHLENELNNRGFQNISLNKLEIFVDPINQDGYLYIYTNQNQRVLDFDLNANKTENNAFRYDFDEETAYIDIEESFNELINEMADNVIEKLKPSKIEQKRNNCTI